MDDGGHSDNYWTNFGIQDLVFPSLASQNTEVPYSQEKAQVVRHETFVLV